MQWWTLEKTDHTLRVQQRASISVAIQQLLPTIELRGTPPTAKFASILFPVSVTNSGNSGTRDLTVFAKCATSVEALQEPWSILHQGISDPPQSSQFLGPHGTSQMYCGFSFEQIKAMRDGKLHGYVMADVTYRDRLDNTLHRTQATVKLLNVSLGLNDDGPISIFIIAYGRHNCADEECPP